MPKGLILSSSLTSSSAGSYSDVYCIKRNTFYAFRMILLEYCMGLQHLHRQYDADDFRGQISKTYHNYYFGMFHQADAWLI